MTSGPHRITYTVREDTRLDTAYFVKTLDGRWYECAPGMTLRPVPITVRHRCGAELFSLNAYLKPGQGSWMAYAQRTSDGAFVPVGEGVRCTGCGAWLPWEDVERLFYNPAERP